VRAAPQGAEFATVADGVRAQVVRRNLLPAHLSSGAHEGRAASCPCRPLLEQLRIAQRWQVVPRGAREQCVAGDEHHDLRPLAVATWPTAPASLLVQALHQRVAITVTMCCWCGAVEVRDVSFHVLAGARAGSLAPRRRSDVLGWYAGARPGGRVYT